MDQTERDGFIIARDIPILVTGASGFIGPSVVASLLDRGFRNVRCFVRLSSNLDRLEAVSRQREGSRIELIRGNLLSEDDCTRATRDVGVIFHLAASRGEKSFPAAFMDSVVTTRNLLEASLRHAQLRRFVTISSFAVYANISNSPRRVLDESCPIEQHPELRAEAYTFAKVRQDEIVAEYGKRCGIPYVIVRPGSVYGPGNEAIPGRVGIGTFGVFLHLGGSNAIPFTYVDNCAEAIALAGLKQGVGGEVFNVVDDDLPSSRQFLRLYKQNVRRFTSIYVPHMLSYILCCLWEKYSDWSEEQLPPVWNRKTWNAYWKKTRYSNERAKAQLGWTPSVPTSEGFRRYFESCRTSGRHA